ncbi:STAS domain-containing protein [Zavarzinella formosa]|uniref:STAS domain-containing protein n=1 Tax=Zavarzinella formosa TaxID=360055 RepID=UPI0003080FBC|nr:STAS domain-containing protein [Zavarzinella formosa]
MADTYRLLRVRAIGDELLAVAPVTNLHGNPDADSFRADLRILENCLAKRVRLDVGEVTIIDGSFMAAVVKLWKILHARAVEFTVTASTPLAEIMAITKLDKLFPVIVVPVADSPLIVYAPVGD